MFESAFLALALLFSYEFVFALAHRFLRLSFGASSVFLDIFVRRCRQCASRVCFESLFFFLFDELVVEEQEDVVLHDVLVDGSSPIFEAVDEAVFFLDDD